MTRYAHPDLVVPGFLDFTPNDPYYSDQYYLNNTDYPVIDIDAPNAWNITQGDSQIVIAVIDDGIQDIHEDLDSSKFYMGYDFVGPYYKYGPNPDDDPDPNPTSKQAHGMCVASIISGSMNNSLGITGVSPNCRLMRLKFSDDNGALFTVYPDTVVSGTMPSVCAQAIEYAYLNGAHVINGSWGWDYPFTWPVVTDAVEAGYDSGVVMVFAAGNNGETPIKFPASLEHTISVGAIKRDGDRWGYSNYGPNLDVVAPSGSLGISSGDVCTLDIVGDSGGYNSFYASCSNTNGDYVCYFGGTSAAAPQVAGVVALMLSRNRDYFFGPPFDLLPYQRFLAIRGMLHNSAADQVGNPAYDTPGFDYYYGYGLLNAYQALLQVPYCCNGDGVRGNVDYLNGPGGEVGVADLSYIVDYLHRGGPAPPCIDEGNVDGIIGAGGPIDVADESYLVDFLFRGCPPPPSCP